MTDETNPPIQPGTEPRSRAPRLDPDPVDNPAADVNRDRCQIVDTTGPDGEPIVMAVHGGMHLTGADRAALGEIARAAIELDARINPHGGVIQELMLSSVRSRALLRVAGHGDVAHRLGAAVRAAADLIRQIPRGEGRPVTSSAEWGVRWTDGERVTFEARDTKQDALEHIDSFDGFDDVRGVLVHRTVTRTEWQTAADQLPGA